MVSGFRVAFGFERFKFQSFQSLVVGLRALGCRVFWIAWVQDLGVFLFLLFPVLGLGRNHRTYIAISPERSLPFLSIALRLKST